MIRKTVFVLAAALLFSSSAYAAAPSANSVSLGNFSFPTANSTRTNVYINFQDESGQNMHQPESLVKVWARFRNVAGVNCGVAATTATLVMTNGATVVMKKDLDYTFVVPMVHNYWALEFNAKIPQANLLGVCFQMTGYGADGNGLPSEANY